MELWQSYLDKFGIKKIYWVTVLILLMLGIINSVLVDHAGKRFTLEGNTFVYDAVNEHVWTFKDSQGQSLTAFTEHRQYSLDFDTILYINYGNAKIKRISDFGDFSRKIFNGDKLVYTGGMHIYTGDIHSDSVFEYKLISGVLSVSSHVQSGLLLYSILSNVFLIFLGSAQVAFPNHFWHFRHFLDVKGGEPTDFYLLSTRVLGIVLTLAGVFWPFAFL